MASLLPRLDMAAVEVEAASSSRELNEETSHRQLIRSLSTPLAMLFPSASTPAPPNSPTIAATMNEPLETPQEDAALLENGSNTAPEEQPQRPTLRAASNGDDSGRHFEMMIEQQLRSELRQLFRRFQNVLPFSILLLLYLSYQHTKGIAGFIIGTIAIITLDIRFREQVTLKDKSNPLSLIGITLVCIIDIFAISSLNGDLTPYDTFLKDLDDTQATTFTDILWAVMANDYILRFTSMTAKALVALVKVEKIAPFFGRGPILNISSIYRRKRKIYALIEFTTIFLRTMVAAIPWCSYYQACSSKLVADVFTLTYLGFKGYVLGGQAQKVYEVLRALISFNLEYGVYISPSELLEAGNPECSICYDTMQTPVQLRCSHMFCEECVCEWFDRERNCPLCRADVMTEPTTTTEQTKPLYLDGGTQLIPQLL
ncbi:hypothetical protein THRCLA_07081 [Thraustotheca clavata]|uniref:RING-type domain-containing protein n=1 Tax=Thraustotheca clavata TaxID=74557 RepID=A0A1V9ZH06_9STRA|nr:hypothetical protein THRCLA_07081 [Thraustotheca clavata]